MELSDTVYKINTYEMLKEIKDGNKTSGQEEMIKTCCTDQKQNKIKCQKLKIKLLKKRKK